MTAAPLAKPAARPSLFQASLAISLAAHAVLFGWLERAPKSGPIEDFKPDVIDVDVKTPFRPRSPDDKRQPGKMKGAPAPAELPRAPFPVPPPPDAKAAAKPKQAEEGPITQAKPQAWTLPTPETKVLLPPKLDGAPAEVKPVFTAPGATGPGGMNGQGEGDRGEGTGGPLVNRPPRLINKEEVMASLKRLYPEVERRAGRQGKVVLEIEINAKGAVSAVDVAQSGGELFDDAARAVGRIMRFEPELKASIPVVSHKRQSVYFQLTNE